jgi:hypothetical protein
MNMNKTCEGCRAYEYINNVDRKCSLGYYQERGEPKEKCPKPKTIDQLVIAPKSKIK